MTNNILKSKIAVVGSCVTDQITYASHTPQPGETVEGADYAEGFGGKGANQAVAAALCGADVYMIGRVGSDTRGRETIANFKNKGVDCAHVLPIDGAVTGVAPIWVDTKTGQNSIIVVLGANNNLTPNAVDEAADTLKKMDFIVMQREMPNDTIYHVIDFARKNEEEGRHITTILNVAPPPKANAPIDFSKLNGLDYLVVNETEAAALLNKPQVCLENAKTSTKELLSKAEIANVILTLGCDGLVWTQKGCDPVTLPAYDMKSGGLAVIDTTGAGDAFIGSFTAFMGSGADTERALKLASFYAGLSVTQRGTQSSYPCLADFKKEYQNWKQDQLPSCNL